MVQVQADASQLRALLEERAESLAMAKKALAEIDSKLHRASNTTHKLKVRFQAKSLILNT